MASGERFAGLVKAAQSGVTIGFGTDSGSPVVQHDVVAPEMAFMIKLGIKKDAYDALRSATSVAARISRLDSKLGYLKPGYLADVIVVDGQPDLNIEDISKVSLTLVEGRRVFESPSTTLFRTKRPS